ncbi:GGDEF domain-containing protein [Marinicella gelatinilytica]|uniref:GGDEF domain-containing protein n=1 Tax=Marinicella gelatinilytica TaxID=2996017 RepID=UPI002260F2CD|nr:GGDEF domain-containing protein [Marinicella gelatinilytica]MCX7543942.1 GGDEF domain-containing protein [Marinicella gelatinilytica]
MTIDNQAPRLKTYLLFNKFLKFKKLKYKLFTLAFLATHVPLISYIAYIFLSKQHNWSIAELLLILLATLAGTAFVLWSIHHLLKPLNYSVQALDHYLEDSTIIPLPHHINDEMGQLMRSIEYTLHSLDRRYKDLETVSSYDFLTDLHNRRSAKAKLKNDLVVNDNQPLCPFIIMIDLDRFKAINDSHGHFAGDVVLKDLAKEIKNSFMTADDWAARWGGDEFLLILHGNELSVNDQLHILRKNISNKQLSFENHQLTYTISIGMCAYTGQQSIHETIKLADSALLMAKNKGKNQIQRA